MLSFFLVLIEILVIAMNLGVKIHIIFETAKNYSQKKSSIHENAAFSWYSAPFRWHRHAFFGVPARGWGHSGGPCYPNGWFSAKMRMRSSNGSYW
jgi:hypothetical protein